MAEKFWFRAGYWSAVAFRVIMIAIALYGVVHQVMDHEVPYAPLALLFAFLAWMRILGAYEGIVMILQNMKTPVVNNSYNFTSEELENAVNAIMFKNMYTGGPN